MSCTAWVNTEASVTRNLLLRQCTCIRFHSTTELQESQAPAYAISLALSDNVSLSVRQAVTGGCLRLTTRRYLKQVVESLYTLNSTQNLSLCASRPASRVCVTHIIYPRSLQIILLSQHNSADAAWTKPDQVSGTIACYFQQTNRTLVHCQWRT